MLSIEQWLDSLDITHEIARVHLTDGRTVSAGIDGAGVNSVIHRMRGGPLGEGIEIDRWRGDDENKELEVEIIPIGAVTGIVWRDPKRK